MNERVASGPGEAMSALADEIRAVLLEFADAPDAPDAPLELESLVVVQLVEALEDRFGFVARAAELGPENLGTLAALTAWVDRRVRGGPA